MIYGIGIDIVRIERMTRVVGKWGKRFLERVFTEDEISYCYAKKEPYLSLSVRFAAKEALIKAIGPVSPVSLTDIEIVNVEMGKPILRVKGKVESILKEKLIKKAHLSLSHEHEYGIACVVLEH
jgi:phosphopantetheine--protein transferase-like protein